nr:histidine phosphatase family protein [uncultured Cohaesibacter sp.]
MPIPPLYFIRHGQTDWNAQYRFQGRRDIPLNEKGKSEARRNGQRLAELVADPSDMALFCSPMTRTRQTLAGILEASGWQDLPWADSVVFDPRLVEITFGDWEGWTKQEIKKNDPENYKARVKDKWSTCPPNGESYAEMSERVRPWLESLTGPTIVVAHGGTMRVLRQILENVPVAEAPLLEVPQNKVYCWTGTEASWQ